MFSIPMYDPEDSIKDGDFLSIIILSYRRPEYTVRLLESIKANADSLIEIVLFDDASPEEDQVKLYNEARHLCSSMVFNTGQPLVNGGFSAAANRAVSLTNSRYVLLLNNDLQMVGPGFQSIKKALDIPYVGCVGPAMGMDIDQHKEQKEIVVLENGVQLHLGSIPQSSGMFAFRKELWRAVGGFPYVYHNNADTSFHHIVLKHSMFNATIVNESRSFRNIDMEDGYVNATQGTTPFDQSYPHILGIDHEAFARLCVERKDRRYVPSHESYRTPFGLNNIASWSAYFEEARVGDGTFDWEKLAPYEQNKWRDRIEVSSHAWRNQNG